MAALCCCLWVALPPVHICPVQIQKLHTRYVLVKSGASIACIPHKPVPEALSAAEASSPMPATSDMSSTCAGHAICGATQLAGRSEKGTWVFYAVRCRSRHAKQL